MGDLTEYFSEHEIACRGKDCCGGRLFPEGNFKEAYRFWMALEKLREKAGRPITVTSGYRCVRHNYRTPGAAMGSKHTKGYAADIVIEGCTPEQMMAFALLVPEFAQGGIGIYNDRIHVDSRPDGPARWDKRDNLT